MSSASSQEWFLEVEGKRTGPFTTDQIVGLFQDGEVPGTQRITSASSEGKWITVNELVDSNKPKPFHPPPRPADLTPSQEVTRPSISSPKAPAQKESSRGRNTGYDEASERMHFT